MTVQLPGTEEDGSRKRKAHNKSRRGCRNCKLRRVKCDETKPKCNKCTTFGVTCNYDPKAADLQMSFDGVVSMKIPLKSTAIISRPPRPITKMPDFLYPPIISDNLSSYHMDRQSLERLDRFHKRTVLSLGTARTAPLFQAEVFKLAYSAPYLMHVIQAITAIHDRYLSPTADPHYSPTEIYHWSKAASLFNQKLSAPVRLEDRDALWATAVLFGSTAFSWVEASTPEEVWPLKPSDPSDLEWLRMSEGKMSVWKLTDPLRPDSVFHVLASENKKDHSFAHTSKAVVTGLEGFPAGFIQLYGLDESSTEENNPYHAAVHALAPLLHIQCNQSTIAIFLMVIPYMGPRFKNLLGMKDPRALLLLAYWYAKVCDSVWWISRRALLECQAICLYLQRYYADEVTIQELLEFPRMRCQTLTQAAR